MKILFFSPSPHFSKKKFTANSFLYFTSIFLDVFLFFSHGDCTTIFTCENYFFSSRSDVAHSQPPLQFSSLLQNIFSFLSSFLSSLSQLSLLLIEIVRDFFFKFLLNEDFSHRPDLQKQVHFYFFFSFTTWATIIS